jgi:hypothetical protein
MEPPFVVDDNYQVLDVIGEGAYGVVWFVHFLLSHLYPDRVCPKFCRPCANPTEGGNQAYHTL